ncbi:MAG: hypothetical protein KC777_22560, partial [Cyanobacteria bacterium HKST-UBA02]|nr:hypothetical protein [Cyanobacteria bacterium HKST-UBA02]
MINVGNIAYKVDRLPANARQTALTTSHEYAGSPRFLSLLYHIRNFHALIPHRLANTNRETKTYPNGGRIGSMKKGMSIFTRSYRRIAREIPVMNNL